MTGTAVCENCGRTFKPLETAQADMIRRCAKANDEELGIECPLCEDYTMINPVAIIEGRDGTVISTPNYRCPVSACTGWVDLIDEDDEDLEIEGPYWGCGECGSLWKEKANLFKEIDEITKKFKYRKKCYKKSKGEWIPADIDDEPEDYEERVEDEPDDECEEFVRG